jgi:hypothetical protein
LTPALAAALQSSPISAELAAPSERPGLGARGSRMQKTTERTMLYSMGKCDRVVTARTGIERVMRAFGLFLATLGLAFILIAVVQYVIAFLGPGASWFCLLVGVGILLMAVGAELALIDRA